MVDEVQAEAVDMTRFAATDAPAIPEAEAALLARTWIITRPLRWRNRDHVEQDFEAGDAVDFDEYDIQIEPRGGGISLVDFVDRGLIRSFTEGEQGDIDAMSRDELLVLAEKAQINSADGSPFARNTPQDHLLAAVRAHFDELADGSTPDDTADSGPPVQPDDEPEG